MVTQVVRIIFLSLVFCSGCNFPEDQKSEALNTTEQLALRNEAAYYTGQFNYKLENCKGNASKNLNQHTQKGSLQIRIDKEKIQFLRNDKASHLKTLVKSSWDTQTRKLSDSEGQLGIAATENWRESVGTMSLSEENEISGKISNIHIVEKQNFCEVFFRFKGMAKNENG